VQIIFLASFYSQLKSISKKIWGLFKHNR